MISSVRIGAALMGVGLTLGLLALHSPTPAQKKPAPAKPKSTQKAAKIPERIVWQYDFNKAFKQAKQQKRILMVDFYADW